MRWDAMLALATANQRVALNGEESATVIADLQEEVQSLYAE